MMMIAEFQTILITNKSIQLEFSLMHGKTHNQK